MAYQDDAGLRSVKHSVHAGGWTSAARPSGSAVAFIALEATPEKQDRPLESRPSWWIRKRASFFGGDERVPRFGGNSEAATPSAGMHQSWCSKGDGCPSGRCGQDSIRKRAALSLGKVQARFDALRVTSEPLCRVHESRLSWRRKECCILSRGGVMRLLSTGGNSRIATPNARVTPVVVYGFVLRLSREVAWRIRRAGGNFSTAISCARVTLVVAPGCVLQSSRGRQGGSGTLGLAPELSRTARIKDLRLSWPGCVLRLLREVQDGSKRWTHTPELSRPVRQSAVRNQRANQSPSGGGYGRCA